MRASRADCVLLPPFTLAEEDPSRAEKEASLRRMSDADLLTLYHQTRSFAAAATRDHDMPRLLPMVRGMKTIQRIAAERGLIIRREKRA